MKLVCIMCPLGCEMDIADDKNGGIKVTGNTCIRGENYAKSERTRPMRTVSSLVKVKDRVVPVKTTGLVPKDKIDEILNEIGKISLDVYPKFGTIILKDVLNLGVDVVSIGY